MRARAPTPLRPTALALCHMGLRTPPPWSGFVSEANKAANAGAALANVAGKYILYVTGREPTPTAASESAAARGWACGKTRVHGKKKV